MRVDLDDNVIRRPTIKSGLKFAGLYALAITATFTIPTDAPVVIALDATSTARNVVLPALVEGLEHHIVNISTGTAVLTIQNAVPTTIGSIGPGEIALCKVVNGVWYCFPIIGNLAGAYLGFYGATPIVQPVGADQGVITDSSGGTKGFTTAVVAAAFKSTIVTPVGNLADLANAQVYRTNVPFAFTLLSAGFRTGKIATTAAKLASLTATVGAQAALTGGVIALTSANQGTSGVLTAASAISGATATGTAGMALEWTLSAVTAFVEGTGFIESVVSNNDLANSAATIIAADTALRLALVNLGLIKGAA